MQYAGRHPYGEIFEVSTKPVDDIAKRLYAEKQQRELQQRQESKMLDDEFGKNLAKVKSVDIPEITEAYNNYKQANIALMKKGNKSTPEDHMAVMISKAKVNEKINGSVEDKEYLKLRATEGKTSKRYKLGYNTLIQQELNKPTSQRDREKDDELFMNQYSFPDLEKVSANMLGGKPVEIKLPTGKPSTNGDLYNDKNVYQKFNTPNQMYDNAFLDVSRRPDREAYERIVLDSLSDQEKESLKTRYFAKINSPEFKAIYGDVQPFPESAGQTELGQAVALSVMSAVDKLPIQPLRTESKQNIGLVMDKKRKEGMEDWLKKNKITFGQSMAKIAANKAAGKEPEDLGYLSDNVNDEVGVTESVTTNGKTESKRVVYVDKVDPDRLDIITGRDLSKKKFGVKPIAFKGGKLGYYVDEGTGDWIGQDGQIISREAVKDRYIQSKAGTKFKAESGTKGSENTRQKPKKDPLGLF